MIDSELTKLIENIEDNLIKHIQDINEFMKVEDAEITQLVITKEDKTYPSTATTEDILNDTDNIVIDVVPMHVKPIKGSVCLLPKERRDDLLSKMKIGINTIQSIKNNLASLSYTDQQIKIDIIKDRLNSKISTLNVLEYAISQSIIFNQEIKNSDNELLLMIEKLRTEIERDNKKSEANEENTGKPKQYKLKLTEKIEEGVLENYQFWNYTKDANKSNPAYRNIFNGITQSEFLEMVSTADFSTLNKKKIGQRVKCNINILARFLGETWGNEAASRLNTTLADCQKRTEFVEWEELKSMYVQ